jgi:hypothetical protein
MFFFKFTLRCKQSDIVPIITRRCCYTSGKFATSINDISNTGGKFTAGVIDTGGAP